MYIVCESFFIVEQKSMYYIEFKPHFKDAKYLKCCDSYRINACILGDMK